MAFLRGGLVERANVGGSLTPPDVQYFPTSGTWNKPDGAKRVVVLLIEGGPGGGSGRVGASGSNRFSGEGAAAGRATIMAYDADMLGATEVVTVGAGGAGGAAQTADDSNGKTGKTGGGTYFGGTDGTNSIQAAVGALPGRGGGTSAVSPPNLNVSVDSSFQYYSGRRTGTFSGAGGAGDRSAFGPGGGGAGGGLNTSNTETGGGNGAPAANAFFSTDVSGGKSGGAAGGGAGANGAAGTTDGTTPFIFGGGGGGGGSATAANGGAGGDGGAPGGGGGGGGSAQNGFDSGAGGDGGDGGAFIITYF